MDYLGEFYRQQALTIVTSCGRCQRLRYDVPATQRPGCERCGLAAIEAVFSAVDGVLQWEHEHMCSRCAARGRETFGGIDLGSPTGSRWARGGRRRKAGGRQPAQRASGHQWGDLARAPEGR